MPPSMICGQRWTALHDDGICTPSLCCPQAHFSNCPNCCALPAHTTLLAFSTVSSSLAATRPKPPSREKALWASLVYCSTSFDKMTWLPFDEYRHTTSDGCCREA